MMDIILSLPFILAVALFIAIVILARILLSPESALERRRSSRDRRKNHKVPQMPFYDNDRILVTQDRRRRDDRRKRSFVITTTQKRI